MRTNYVLIDFENVRPQSLELLEHDHFKVVVFVGASQHKIPTEIADSLQRHGSRAEYVRISGNGRNALDFHIAYYVGKLAAAEPSAYFHIVSNDGGFDPLIEHLKTKKIFAGRVQSIAEIPLVKSSNSKSSAERQEVVLARLQQLKGSKPRTVKTLSSTIASLFPNKVSEEEVAGLISALVKQGLLLITGTKVAYALPSDG